MAQRQALGGQIADYLTKPVNPSQVLLTCKRILDRSRIRSERVSQDYLKSFSEISRRLMEPLSHTEWVELYQTLVRYDAELAGDEGVRQVLEDQYHEANRAFSNFVEESYPSWIRSRTRAPDERMLNSSKLGRT